MSSSRPWLSALARLASAIDDGVDLVRTGVRGRLSGERVLRVAAYRTYGTPRQLRVAGRVLRDAPLSAAAADASAWANLRATYQRFETDEVPGARVRARFGDITREASADREGYFDVTFDLADAVAPGEHLVDVELLEPRADVATTARAPVLVPAGTARFAVVSDIDDTVIRTDVTEFVRMARSVLLGNVHTRLPFPGVATFYQALRGGPDGHAENPLFYVSSSPWNLYELLDELFALRGIPAGPIMLRDWGLTSGEGLPTGHAGHKGAAIRRIFDTYSHLPFILVGDSGQEDPEIYAAIIREYPGRVLAAYIRSVHRAPERIAAMTALAGELAAEGASLVVTDDTLAAARHAAEKGWIVPASVDRVAADVTASAASSA